jgi:hypothetical protein
MRATPGTGAPHLEAVIHNVRAVLLQILCTMTPTSGEEKRQHVANAVLGSRRGKYGRHGLAVVQSPIICCSLPSECHTVLPVLAGNMKLLWPVYVLDATEFTLAVGPRCQKKKKTTVVKLTQVID